MQLTMESLQIEFSGITRANLNGSG